MRRGNDGRTRRRNAAATAAPSREPPSGRDAIVAAAATLFMERGYAATSIDDVADLLGATKGRVYHYYDSKAELFFDVQTTAMQLIQDAVAPIAGSGLPPSARLHAMALEHARVVMRYFTFEKVLVQGIAPHMMRGDTAQKRMRRQVIRMRDDYEELFAAVIAAGVKSGDFKGGLPPRLAAKLILGALNWLVIWFEPREKGDESETIARALADFALAGMQK